MSSPLEQTAHWSAMPASWVAKHRHGLCNSLIAKSCFAHPLLGGSICLVARVLFALLATVSLLCGIPLQTVVGRCLIEKWKIQGNARLRLRRLHC